jgi:hypothetical protein
MDGPTEVSLENMGVKSIEELLALPTDQVARRLGSAPFPPSEKLIGAVMLVAVQQLHKATDDLAGSSRRMDRMTRWLVTAAYLTLAVAFVSLVVAVIAVAR